MVKVICQHSGIEFDASSKRTRQHPLIASMKDDANKRGNYGEVTNALDAVRKAGGYTTIEQYIQMVKDHLNGKQQAVEASRKKAQERAAHTEEKKKAFRAWLPANGYQVVTENYTEWVEVDYDDMGKVVDRTRKYILAPDGEKIDEWQAQAIFEGKQTLESYRASVRQAQEAAVTRKADQEAEEKARQDTHEESVKQFDAEVANIKSVATQVARFEFPRDYQVITTIERGNSSYRAHDRIEHAQVNGVDVWLVISGSGYDDDGYYSYYCADPTAAGLSPLDVKPDTTPRFF